MSNNEFGGFNEQRCTGVGLYTYLCSKILKFMECKCLACLYTYFIIKVLGFVGCKFLVCMQAVMVGLLENAYRLDKLLSWVE